MKITLVNPLSTPDSSVSVNPHIPYGVAYIAAVLEKEGYQVSIWDRNVNREDIERFYQPDIIGLSVMTGPCISDAIEISQKAKAIYPEVSIVWGGVHPTILPEQTIVEEYIDYIVYGEGELTMLDLVKSIEHNFPIEEVKGIYYKNGDKILKTPPRPPIKNLDDLPFPAWHLFDMKRYINYSLHGRAATLNTSRGCPFNCSFCSEPAFSKRRWRGHSSQRVIEMVEYMKSNFKVDYIIFRESMFLANRKRVEDFCDGLILKKLNMQWHCPARIQNWDKDLLKKMRQAGCVMFEFGVESGCPRILKILNKRITLEQVYDTFKKCNEVGIIPQINLMCGIPTETKEEFDMTIELLNRLNHGPIDLMAYVPYPGTELYNFAVSQGLFVPPSRLQDWALISDLHGFEFSLGEVDKETLWKAKRETLKINETQWRKLAIRTLMQNPKTMMNLHFILGALKFVVEKSPRK